MNNVSLRGRLTENPMLKTFMKSSGDTDYVLSFVLAVPDRTSKKDEKGNYEADFIRCSIFGKSAEVIDAFAVKGTEIIITNGKIKTGSYEKEGVKIFTTEVSVQAFEFVSGTKSKEENKK